MSHISMSVETIAGERRVWTCKIRNANQFSAMRLQFCFMRHGTIDMTLNLSYETLNLLHNRVPGPEVNCGAAWAPTSPKTACAIDSPWRGIRTIAESG